MTQDLATLIETARDAQSLVCVTRHVGFSDDDYVEGYLLDSSDSFLLLEKVSDRIDLDGYDIIRVVDVEDIETSFDEKSFYESALAVKGERPRKPSGIDLTDIRAVLTSCGAAYPLLVIERELRAPDECEIGQIKLLTDDSYALRWLSPSATWEDDFEIYKLDDITRVSFGGEYERTLAHAAGLTGPTLT